MQQIPEVIRWSLKLVPINIPISLLHQYNLTCCNPHKDKMADLKALADQVSKAIDANYNDTTLDSRRELLKSIETLRIAAMGPGEYITQIRYQVRIFGIVSRCPSKTADRLTLWTLSIVVAFAEHVYSHIPPDGTSTSYCSEEGQHRHRR